MRKTVIIGLDGVPYSLLKRLTERDVMPNLKDLMSDGVFTQMQSSIPCVSSVSWSSIITGRNPGEHGVYGFTDIIPGTYSIGYHSIRKLRAKPFWIVDNHRKYVILNVPSTFPAQEINGVIVTGFVSPDIKRSVYPPEYLDILEEIDYRIDADISLIEKSKHAFINDLFQSLVSRVRLYRYLWEKVNWDIFMLVVTGTDRLGHYFWDAYEDKGNPFHDAFLQFFKAVDHLIGEICGKISEDTHFMILSDHGMELKHVNVYLNAYLKKEGFLHIDNGRKGLSGITRKTLAFALDPNRLYINTEERYPRGSVKNSEREKVIEDLVDAFRNLVYNGRKVIQRIYRREEVYHGDYLDHAPDLLLIPYSGFNLMARSEEESVFGTDNLTGMHNPEAFIYTNLDIELDKPSVEDVLKIMGWKYELVS